jgi:transcription elongation factor S-II
MEKSFLDCEPEKFRINIRNYFCNLINDESIGKNIEVSIYNYAVNESKNQKIIKKWKNEKFIEIYSGRLRTIIFNLKNNNELVNQLKTKQISLKSFSTMTHQEMCPELWRKRIENKIKRDNSKLTTNIEASTDMFTCKKCRSKKCTYYEMQTRSADEPATIFITCLDCGKNWKN